MPDFENLTELEQRILGMVETRPSPGKHAARSAIHHAERARRIQGIDPEMALFRALTGEEEAARAIIHSLHRLRYPGAERLNWKVHRHKAAMIPFLAAVGGLIKKGPITVPQLQIVQRDGKDQPSVRFEFMLPDGQVVGVTPRPPLDLQLSVNDALHDFSPELDELLVDSAVKSLDKMIELRATERNGVLYATESGVPTITGDIAPAIEVRRGNIFACIAVFLLVDTFQVHQRFVLQCLPTYLKMLSLLPPPTGVEPEAS
ncbi:MAG: hypothetical protein ABIQ41_05400 [Gemmatimonadales bacterium]